MVKEEPIACFQARQMNGKYFGKQFSILGDSISTLEGYNPEGYKVFYSGDNCTKANVSQMSDTWWGKVISFFGGKLLVNNSWSGSRVTKLLEMDQLFPSGCSDERTSSLHIHNVKPDVILIYMGTNDWAFGAKTGNETRIFEEDDNESFNTAYGNMLQKLKRNYPQSEIWCCTLCETFMSNRRDFQFPHKHAGIHIEEYNNIIREWASKNMCSVLDLYSYKMPYDSIDGSHPNADGMRTLASMMIHSITGEDMHQFPARDSNSSEYASSEEHPDGSNYVFQDPNITKELRSNALRLTIESTDEVVQFQKEVVSVGREAPCDLLLDGKNTVSRQQATFFYEKDMWFLRDDFSTNGTWMNDARMQPGKKYQLIANDEINFAMAEKVIFDKRA